MTNDEAMMTLLAAQPTRQGITDDHNNLVQHILAFDPEIISPNTKAALQRVERLARLAYVALDKS